MKWVAVVLMLFLLLTLNLIFKDGFEAKEFQLGTTGPPQCSSSGNTGD